MKKSVLLKEAILVLVTIIWGGGFIAQVYGGTYLDAYSFIFLRSLIAIIFIGCVVLVLDGQKKRKGENYKETDKKGLIKGGILIGLMTAVAMVFQQIGVMAEGAGKSGFLTTLYIVIIPIIELFRGKKINAGMMIAIVLAVTGLYLINVNDGHFTFSFGTIMLLCCALSYAIQILFIDKFAKGYDVTKLSFIEFCAVALAMLPMMLIFGELTWSGFIKALPALLYLSICSTGLTSMLQMYAQKEVDVTVASIIMSLESVFSTIMGVLILHESHTLIQYLGCVIIFVAVILTQVAQRVSIKKVELN